MNKAFVSVLALVVSMNAQAFIENFVTSGCTPGVWTYDLDAAKSYAKKQGTFYLMVLAKDGGCGYCKNAASKIWNDKEFKQWAKDNKIPLVYANYNAGVPAVNEFRNNYIGAGVATSVPVLAAVDGASGKQLIGSGIVWGGSRFSQKSTIGVEVGSEGYYADALDEDTPKELVDFWMSRTDDAPVASDVSSTNYGKQPRTLKANETTDKTLTVNGSWGTWGVNSLNSKWYLAGTTVICYADDRQDWYKFTNSKAGESYIVTCPTLTDKSGLGYLCVYTSEAAAKKAAASFEKAKANAAYCFSMTDLSTKNGRGRAFTVPKGTMYLAFVRRAAKKKENITIKYTFTLQKGVLDAFEFENAKEERDEYDAQAVRWETAPSVITNNCSLTVCRESAGTETTATVTFTDGTAKKNTDYLVTQTSVKFDKNATKAELPFKIISKRGVWTGDRDFSVAIAKDAKAGSKKTSTVVTIKDVDPAKDDSDSADDTISGASVISLPSDVGVMQVLTNRLNGTLPDGYNDTRDWFKITGRHSERIPCMSFDPLVTEKVAFKLEFLYGGDGKVLYLSTNLTSRAMFALPPNLFTNDVYVCVSDTRGKSYHCGVYELAFAQIEQPVAEFASAVPTEISYDSPSAPSNIAYGVSLNKLETSPYYKDWEKYLPRWRTVDGTAKGGVDFAGTSAQGANLNVSTTASADWALKVRSGFVPDNRRLTVELLPDEQGYYRLGGKSSVAVTIKGDNAIPALPVTNQVGKAFVKAEGRNLNYTNKIDNVYYTGIRKGVDYVLGAENVRVKPETSVINVAVYTNGVTLTAPGMVSSVTNTVALMTNEVGVATNCYAALCKELKATLPEAWCEEDEFGVETNCFKVVIDRTNTVFFVHGTIVSNVAVAVTNRVPYASAKRNNTKIIENTCEKTNECKWVRYKLPDGTKQWSLQDLSEVVKMPSLNFAEDGIVRVKVWREADTTVLAEYDIKLTEWTKPVLAFAKSAWTNEQTEAVNQYEVTLSESTQLPTVYSATLTGGKGVGVAAFTDRRFEIPAGQKKASISVTNAMAAAAAKGVWLGNTEFTLTLAVEDPKVTLGKPSVASNVLESVTSEYEIGDNDKESVENPLVKDAPTVAWKSYDRTMNGTDTLDCFWITNVVAGTTYRFRLAYRDGTTNNLSGVGFGKVLLSTNGVKATEVPLTSILNADFDFKPMANGTIAISISRAGISTEKKPISLGYTLFVREWPWPTFDFAEASLEIDNLRNTNAVLRILRSENCEGTNKVKVALSFLEGITKPTTSPALGAKATFTFLPGQTETNWVVSVVANAKTAQGVWTGDAKFRATLSVQADPKIEKVRLGATNTCDVTIKDVESEFDWHDAYKDDTPDVKTNHTVLAVVQTLPECRLNGSDTNDWFRFTGIESNAVYYFECTVDKTNNLSKAGITVSYWHNSSTGDWTEIKPLDSGAVRTDSAYDLYVCVSREKSLSSVAVSAAYTLSFHRISAAVYLTPSAVAVSEKDNFVDLQVVCSNTTALAVPVMVKVWTRNGTATSPSDYTATVVTNIWPTNTMGGARQIRIPLVNRDKIWEGDETFSVCLEALSGAESVHLPESGMSTNVTVTIRESDDPQYGTFAITGVGEPLASVAKAATAVFETREGASVNLRAKRRNGITGDVVVKWYWKDSDGKTVKFADGSTYFCTTNFLSGEKGLGPIFSVPVPVKAGTVPEETWTLAFKYATAGVTTHKGAPTSLKFSVRDENYGGTLPAYSSGIVTNVAFKSAADTWYMSSSGGVRAMTPPAAKKSADRTYTMTSKVTGPGTLSYRVTFTSDVLGGYLKVTGGDKTVTAKKDGDYSVHVSSGTKTLTWSFVRGSSDGDGASVEITDVSFTPDDAFNGYGTFTGPVLFDEVIPGLATLTVSSSGKTSGKFQCADRTWTCSSDAMWDADGRIVLSLTSGSRKRLMTLGIDLAAGTVTNETTDIAVRLARNAWKDKPMNATLAEALRPFVGYYTAVLPLHNDDVSGDSVGNGYLTIDVAASGAVKAAGRLADGTSVSMTSVLVPGVEAGTAEAWLFASPSAYAKGWLAVKAVFSWDKGTRRVSLAAGDVAPVANWTSRAAGGGFMRRTDMFGGEYSAELLERKLPTMAIVYDENMTNATFVSGKKLYRCTRVEMFSPSLTVGTGVFTGKLRLMFAADGTEEAIARHFAYRGVYVPALESLSALVGGGYTIVEGESYGISIKREE